MDGDVAIHRQQRPLELGIARFVAVLVVGPPRDDLVDARLRRRVGGRPPVDGVVGEEGPDVGLGVR
ncbi:hypothetical protein, partial [Pseudolysinimonas sp.]